MTAADIGGYIGAVLLIGAQAGRNWMLIKYVAQAGRKEDAERPKKRLTTCLTAPIKPGEGSIGPSTPAASVASQFAMIRAVGRGI